MICIQIVKKLFFKLSNFERVRDSLLQYYASSWMQRNGINDTTGHAFRGFAQVSSLAKTAGGTRAHDEKHHVEILNWFTDGEQFCVEYQHGAIIKGLHVKGTIAICLVCHMQEGKFDRVHEYVHAHGILFKLIMSLGLRALPLLVKRES